MRVLVGPRTDLGRDPVAAAVAAALAGPGGEVISLRTVGVLNLSRPLSRAEVALLRQALRGAFDVGAGGSRGGQPADRGSPAAERPLIGYLCRGVLPRAAVPASAGEGVRLLAVTDHADLTWRSPLVGPNDPDAGPRFPSMTGVYSPEIASARVGAAKGMIVVPGVAAGVHDDDRPTPYETEMVEAQRHAAMSCELVPVVVVAAHLGLRVAAVLVAGT